jgi:hypothetical protein
MTTSTQATFPETVGPDLSHNGGNDVFVAKINAAGTALDYCGYIGGANADSGYGIAVDADGNAYVTGDTLSNDSTFPVIIGPDLTLNGVTDAFVARVNAAGTALDYCGYIGGAGNENGLAIAVTAGGSAFVGGDTPSSEASFPVTVGPDLSYNGGGSDGFVAKVNAAGTGLDYCGYIGGTDSDVATGIAVGGAGNAYVIGYTISTEASFPVAVGPDLVHNGFVDAFVAKVNASGSALSYCGYIGGSQNDYGRAIALDSGGGAYVTGYTKSDEASFPVLLGPDLSYSGGTTFGDAFIAKVASGGASLDYCGYIGGSGDDAGFGIAVDPTFTATVTGYTNSTQASFPVTVGPDLTHNGGNDAFLAKVSSSDFVLVPVPPTTVEICAGDEADYTINVDPIGGFADPVTLAASGQPAGATAGFSVNPVTPPGSTVLTVGNTGGAAGGSCGITITGTAAGGLSHSVEVTLDVVVLAAPPTLVSPPNGATGQPLRPIFQWSAAAGADSYQLEVDDDPAFGSPAISVSGIAATSYQAVTDLQQGTIYHWRVRSENLCGTGAASTVFSFTTASPPGAFGKIAPANGATGQPTSLSLSWGTSSDATSYEYCIDTSVNGTCNASWISVGNVTSAALSGLGTSTTYSWQVRAVNGQGTTQADGGTWWGFTTESGQPELPFSDGFESGDTSAWSATVP